MPSNNIIKNGNVDWAADIEVPVSWHWGNDSTTFIGNVGANDCLLMFDVQRNNLDNTSDVPEKEITDVERSLDLYPPDDLDIPSS